MCIIWVAALTSQPIELFAYSQTHKIHNTYHWMQTTWHWSKRATHSCVVVVSSSSDQITHIYVAWICVQIAPYWIHSYMYHEKTETHCMLSSNSLELEALHTNTRYINILRTTTALSFVDSVTRWKWRQNLFIDAINSNHIRISRTQSHTWGHYYVEYIVCFHYST